jgi:hypothetical protein
MENEGFEMSLQAQKKESTLAKAMTGQRMQEIQAMVFMAKQFPRDEIDSMNRIKTACSRKALAEVAMYEYPRGGQKVTGPSIRLAEVLLQNWGNMKCGVIELDNSQGESKAMSYAWDIETNAYDEKIFAVKHIRDTKQGAKTLTDNRDIYEKVANEGARRKRACILAVIPAWVIEEAIEQCETTLTSNNPEPLIDRLRKLFDKFKQEFGVTKEMIEKYMGYKTDSFTEKDGSKLQRVYNGIRDGVVKKEEYFEFEKPAPEMNAAEEEFKKLKEQKAGASASSQATFDDIMEASK